MLSEPCGDSPPEVIVHEDEGHLLGLQALDRVFGRGGSFDLPQEPVAKAVIVRLLLLRVPGYIRVHGIPRHHGHPGLLEDGSGDPGGAAVSAAGNPHHLIFLDQLVGDGDGFLGVQSVIVNDELHFFPPDSAAIIDLLYRQVHGVFGAGPVCRRRSGDGGEEPDLDRVLGRGCPGKNQENRCQA